MTVTTTPTAIPSAISVAFLRNPCYLFLLASSVALGHALGTAETYAFPISERLVGGSLAAASRRRCWSERWR